jgi:mRNA interferase RelE/StbE
MTYKVDLASRRVERQIDDLPPDMQHRIIAVLRSLADTPRPFGVEKLMDDLHRIRVGQFRIIYVIDDAHKQIIITKVARRSESTYRRL